MKFCPVIRGLDHYLDGVQLESNLSINLITTLQPNSIEQIRKVNSLLSFCRHSKINANNVNVEVSINNKLHGKVYIFESKTNCTAIISSANFTQNGLSKNHEWGVEITDKAKVQELKSQLLGSIEKKGITLVELSNMKKACDLFKEKNEVPPQKIKLNLMRLIPTNTTIEEFPKNTTFWMKPIGVTKYPVEDGRLFNELELKVHFSTSKTPSIKIGDVLICYGVGAKKILSIYRVEELPEKETSEEIKKEPWKERWDWFSIGKNLTPNYGGKWWEFNINPYELVNHFNDAHPNSSVTMAGGKGLGGLNYGHDKLKLSREFAEYILQEVFKLNRK